MYFVPGFHLCPYVHSGFEYVRSYRIVRIPQFEYFEAAFSVATLSSKNVAALVTCVKLTSFPVGHGSLRRPLVVFSLMSILHDVATR